MTDGRHGWMPASGVRIHAGDEKFVPAIESLLKGARVSILIEMYLVESGHWFDDLIAILVERASVGVKVYFLLDHFGSINVHSEDLERLRVAGVKIAFYNPVRFFNLHRYIRRNHRKLILVDSERILLGGVGFTDRFNSQYTERAWFDVMVGFSGFAVSPWIELFKEVWRRCGGESLVSQGLLRQPTDQGSPARMALSRGWGFDEISRQLYRRMRYSTQRVYVATAYFLPTRKFRRRLKRMARAGADVRLLLPGEHMDHPAIRQVSRRYFYRLLLAGVRIFEYQDSFMHAKIYLCDGWACVGSANLDRWGTRWNLEANQEFMGNDVVVGILQVFNDCFEKSAEVTLSHWYGRSRWQRFGDRVWDMVARVFQRLESFLIRLVHRLEKKSK